MTLSCAAVFVAALSALATAVPARAAVSWQSPETIATVRGIPDLHVGIDARGDAAVTWLNATSSQPYLRIATRSYGFPFVAQDPVIAAADDVDYAMNRGGAAVIAWVEGGRLNAAVRPNEPGVPAARFVSRAPLLEPNQPAGEPRVVIDDQGRATVLWLAPYLEPDGLGNTPARLKAVTLDPTGAPGPVRTLSGPGAHSVDVDGNRRGDVIAQWDRAQFVAFKPAGGDFGPAEQGVAPPQGVRPLDEPHGVSLDGSGNAITWRTETDDNGHGFGYQSYFAFRPPQGPVGPRQTFGDGMQPRLEIEMEESGRAVAAWVEKGPALVVSTRAPGGAFQSPLRTPIRSFSEINLVSGRAGEMIGVWTQHSATARSDRIFATTVSTDGKLARFTRLNVPGEVIQPVAVAANDAGQAVVAWEQRCRAGGAYAVNAASLGVRKQRFPAPCQDRSPPKVSAQPRKPRLRARSIRLRLTCSEQCRLVVGATVVVGKRAHAMPRRNVTLRAAPAKATLRLALTRALAPRVRRAVRAGDHVHLVLRVKAQDRFGNATSRRVRLVLHG